MPVYTTKVPTDFQNTLATGANSLAGSLSTLIGGDPKAEAEARLMGTQMDQNLANAELRRQQAITEGNRRATLNAQAGMYGSQGGYYDANAGKLNAETTGINALNAARQEVIAVMMDPTKTQQEKNAFLAAHAGAYEGEFDLGAIPAGTAVGMLGPDQTGVPTEGQQGGLSALNFATGVTDNWANTPLGFNADLLAQGERNDATIAGDLAQAIAVQNLEGEQELEQLGVSNEFTGLQNSLDRAAATADNEWTTLTEQQGLTTRQNMEPVTTSENAVTRVPEGHSLWTPENQGLLSGNRSAGENETLFNTGGEVIHNPVEADPNAGAMLGGEGIDAQSFNFIVNYNEKKLTNQPTTPAEDLQYKNVFTRIYGPDQVAVTMSDGSTAFTPRQKTIPPGIWDPNKMGFTGQTTNVPAPEDPAVQAATGAAGANPPISTETTTIVPGTADKPKLTEVQTKLMDLGGTFARSVSGMNILTGYDPGTDSFENGGNFPGINAVLKALTMEAIPGAVGEYAGNVIASDFTEMYDYQLFLLTEPLLRFRSGAATPEEEVIRYQRIAPRPGESRALSQQKIKDLNVLADAIAIVASRNSIDLNSVTATDPRMNSLRAQVAQEEARIKAEQAAAPAQPDPGAGVTDPEIQAIMDKYQ